MKRLFTLVFVRITACGHGSAALFETYPQSSGYKNRAFFSTATFLAKCQMTIPFFFNSHSISVVSVTQLPGTNSPTEASHNNYTHVCW